LIFRRESAILAAAVHRAPNCVSKLLNAAKTIWEKGDFTRIAASMRASGEALVPTFGIKAGLKVLDIGCGDGTTALPAARLGAEVLGVDTARNLIEAADRRARKEGLTNLRFRAGDATDLAELQDDTFDLVISVFGAMFAPQPFSVAKEMVRVTRPGGRIMMANWIPDNPTLVAQIFKIRSAYTPPPPEGFVSPMDWGIEANVIERFANAGVPRSDVSFHREIYNFNFSGPPAELMNEFRYYHGETMEAFEVAERNGRAEDLRKELCELFESLNISQRGNVTSIPAAFLRVTVAVP
jgi:SAM-dependent methyltransferase